jgi:hypothetical protein
VTPEGFRTALLASLLCVLFFWVPVIWLVAR